MESQYDCFYADRIRFESEFKFALMGMTVVFFLFSKFVYQVLEDDDEGYYHHVHYPVVSQSIVWIYTDIEEFTNPFFDIMPKNRY